MSRIGKQPVVIPAGVKVNVQGHTVKVEGPKGAKLEQSFHPNIKIDYDEKSKAILLHRLRGAASAVGATLVAALAAAWETDISECNREISDRLGRAVAEAGAKALEVVSVGRLPVKASPTFATPA